MFCLFHSSTPVVDGVDDRIEKGVNVAEPRGQQERHHRRFEVRPVDVQRDAGPRVAHEEGEPAAEEANWKR